MALFVAAACGGEPTNVAAKDGGADDSTTTELPTTDGTDVAVGTAASSSSTAPLAETAPTSNGSTTTTPRASLVVPATRACRPAENGQQIVTVNDAFVRQSGVWAVLPDDFSVRMPVLVGTNDNGKSWIYHCLDRSSNGKAVFFLDEARGWAAIVNMDDSTSLLVRTIDGGQTWGAGRLPAGILAIQDVAFIDERKGWAVGATYEAGGDQETGVVLRSTDGGESWATLSKLTGVFGLHRVTFATALRGWAIDVDGHVASTVDGGATWAVKKLTADVFYLEDLVFADDRTGWVTGHDNRSRGFVWTTVDGGATWTKTGDFPHTVHDVATRDGVVYVGGGQTGTVEVSRDGGRTWTQQVAAPTFTDVWAVNGSIAWAYAHRDGQSGCLYSSTDGWHTWTAHALFTTPSCLGPAG